MTKEECRDYLTHDKDDHRYKYPEELGIVLEEVHGLEGKGKGKNRYWILEGEELVYTYIRTKGYDIQRNDSFYDHFVTTLDRLSFEAKLRWDQDAKRIITIDIDRKMYDFYKTMLDECMPVIDVFISVVTEEVKAMVECPRPNVKEWK